MTAIPSGTKFVGIGASVPTPENKSSQNNAFQEVYTIDDLKDSVLDITTPPTEGDVLTFTSGAPSWEAPTGGSTATTTVVNITSAQIFNSTTTAVELLPALATDEYYDIEKIIFEYNGGNTEFDYDGTYWTIFVRNDDVIFLLKPELVKTTEKKYSLYYPSVSMLDPNNGTTLVLRELSLGSSIYISSTTDGNITQGNGTLRAIITYTVRTFGA